MKLKHNRYLHTNLSFDKFVEILPQKLIRKISFSGEMYVDPAFHCTVNDLTFAVLSVKSFGRTFVIHSELQTISGISSEWDLYIHDFIFDIYNQAITNDIDTKMDAIVYAIFSNNRLSGRI